MIQCVIVLYGTEEDRPETLVSLEEIRNSSPEIARHLAVLLYDNSVEPRQVWVSADGFSSFLYVHNPLNPGLAEAYNEALRACQACGSDWLLLLDQDTRLTAEFLNEVLLTVASSVPGSVGALVPKLIRDDMVLSPQIVHRWNNASVNRDAAGISIAKLTAFNAGACVRVQSMLAIGGFPLQFPLDYLDHAVFFALQTAGWHMFILKSCLQHRLSIHNLEEEMPIARYLRVLDSEWKFVRMTHWGGGTAMHRLRLLKRASKQISLSNKQYARLTWNAAFRSY